MQTINHIQNVEIYLDYATIPSLNYFLHFAENYQDTTTIRLFGLGRFTIPQTIIDRYPAGIIRFCKAKAGDQEKFNQLFNDLLETSQENLNLRFHLNLFHSIDMFLPLLYISKRYPEKITHITLCLYDDGAEGVTTLNKFSEKPKYLAEKLSNYSKQYKEKEQVEIDNKLMFRYQWGLLYSAHYILFNTELLDSNALFPLKHAIGSYQKMDLTRFQQIAKEQQEIVLDIIGVKEQEISYFKDLSQQKKLFLFLGTTKFNATEEELNELEELHLKLLDKYILPDDFILCFKGHPNSFNINQRIKEYYQDKCIYLPDYIPLEILLLIGFNPQVVGGFASTACLYFPANKITDLFFMTKENNGKEHDDHLYKNQMNLMNSMIKLNYLTADKAHYCTEI